VVNRHRTEAAGLEVPLTGFGAALRVAES